MAERKYRPLSEADADFDYRVVDHKQRDSHYSDDVLAEREKSMAELRRLKRRVQRSKK